MGDSKGDSFTVPNQSGVKAPEIKPQATFKHQPSLQLLKAISSIWTHQNTNTEPHKESAEWKLFIIRQIEQIKRSEKLRYVG